MVRKENGFTLMELMVAIALFAVLSAISAPSLMSWRENARLGQIARGFLADMQRAKMAAIDRNQRCTVSFQAQVSGGSQFDYIVYLDENENFVHDAGETLLTQTLFQNMFGGNVLMSLAVQPGETAMEVNASGEPTFAFMPNGLPIKADGNFGAGIVTFNNPGGRQVRVEVTTAGGIRIKS